MYMYKGAYSTGVESGGLMLRAQFAFSLSFHGKRLGTTTIKDGWGGDIPDQGHSRPRLTAAQ